MNNGRYIQGVRSSLALPGKVFVYQVTEITNGHRTHGRKKSDWPGSTRFRRSQVTVLSPFYKGKENFSVIINPVLSHFE